MFRVWLESRFVYVVVEYCVGSDRLSEVVYFVRYYVGAWERFHIAWVVASLIWQHWIYGETLRHTS